MLLFLEGLLLYAITCVAMVILFKEDGGVITKIIDPQFEAVAALAFMLVAGAFWLSFILLVMVPQSQKPLWLGWF